jgi:ubiquinone/menaquinone biosynthesis C-methylase UbiE
MTHSDPPSERPRWLQPAFDLWSRAYDNPTAQALVYRPVHDQVLAAVLDSGVHRVLDVGCGTGILADRLAREAGASVAGCDWSAGMIERAAHRNRSVGWIRGDAMALPVADESFDAVVATEAFHWFPDQAGALDEFHRVIVPGGLLLVALVNPTTRVGARVLATGSRLLGDPADWPTRQDMAALVQRAGFAVQAQRRTPRVLRYTVPTVLTVARRPPAAPDIASDSEPRSDVTDLDGM